MDNKNIPEVSSWYPKIKLSKNKEESSVSLWVFSIVHKQHLRYTIQHLKVSSVTVLCVVLLYYDQIHIGTFWNISLQSKTQLNSFSPRVFFCAPGTETRRKWLGSQHRQPGSVVPWELTTGKKTWETMCWCFSLSPDGLFRVTSLRLLRAPQEIEYPEAKARDWSGNGSWYWLSFLSVSFLTSTRGIIFPNKL